LPSSEIAPAAFPVDGLRLRAGWRHAVPLPARRGRPWRLFGLASGSRRARRPGLGYRAGSRPVLLANQSATAAS